MVTVWPGFLASNRRLASKRTTFLLSSIAQWLHHCSSVAWAADAAISHVHSVSSTIRIDSRIGVLLVELGPPGPGREHRTSGAAVPNFPAVVHRYLPPQRSPTTT